MLIVDGTDDGRAGVGAESVARAAESARCSGTSTAWALRAGLCRAGYRVHGASDGAVGLQHVDRCPPDVILLDPWLPLMDGWTFASLYRSRPGPHAAILLLGAAEESLELAIGAAGSLREPADLGYALPLIGHCAQRHRMRGGPGSAPPTAAAGEGNTSTGRHRERLHALAAVVASVRTAIGVVRLQSLELSAAEQTRPLRTDELRRLRVLRLESDRLYLQLRQYYREFDSLT